MTTPSPPAPHSPPIAQATLWLVVFQALGLLIPLLTLPLLARALGVEVFGQVMLAQAWVFMGVLFIDAGFNTESQRLAAQALTELELHQVLLDNLLARAVCSVAVALCLVVVALLWPGLPLKLVLLSLPLLLGTLALPQWWLVAQHQGQRLGWAATLGRLVSALGIVLSVRSASDAPYAVAWMSVASLLSGLLLWGMGWRRYQAVRAQLDSWRWKRYLRSVRPTIFSGFFASASASTPLLLIGSIVGPQASGLYASAERLTKAAAHLLGFVEQTLMGWLNQRYPSAQAHRQASAQLLRRIALVLLCGCALAYVLAPGVVGLLYGPHFAQATPILQWLTFWLACNGVRKAMLTFWWSATGALHTVARYQWAEALLVPLAAYAGIVGGQGVGLALGLIAVELGLIAAMLLHHLRPATSPTRPL